MKIGIMTWYSYHNYGSALQVTALSEVLKRDNSVDVISYKPRGKAHSLPNNTFSAKLRREFSRRKPTVKFDRHVSNAEREAVFNDFLKRNISFSKQCDTLSDLLDLNDSYDAFVCGSDQIWSPNNYDPHYFLDFVKDPAKMIAYAPSIGLPTVEDKFAKEEIGKNIGRFKHLSLREQQGADLVKRLFGYDAKVVCDPSMLLTGDDWRKICCVTHDAPKRPYLLVYMLGINDSHWSIVNEIAMKRGLDIKIIPVYESDNNRVGCIYEAVGPYQFISLIDRADVVCTDSFHGMVFSLLMHTQFVPFERFDDRDSSNQNSRIYNLLSKFSLSENLISYCGNSKEIIDIDFSKTDKILDDFRAKSLEYLVNSLSSVEKKESQTIRRVRIRHDLCTGCGSCALVCPTSAIKIKCGNDGFFKAIIDESKCINCGKCFKKCPFESIYDNVSLASSELYSYKSGDFEVLQRSSSGGFAHDASKMLLKNGYAVAGCTFDKTTKRAKHILVRSIEELHLLQGSKYMQSDFRMVLEEIKGYSGKVAIFGTPCQISGAKHIFADRDDIIYIDLICHGVPTYNLYKKYLIHLEKHHGLKKEDINTVFRYKQKGWKERYIYSADLKKTVCTHQNSDKYYLMFENCDCFSEACYECRWRDSSEADIRIGDYWGPRFKDDDTGVSMVLSMNSRGDEILKLLVDEASGTLKQTTVDDYMMYQQTCNISRPAYYHALIGALADASYSLDEIYDRFNCRAVPLPLDLAHLPNRIVKGILGKTNYEKLKTKLKR